MFGYGLNDAIKRASYDISRSTERAAHEAAIAERAKGDAIKEGLNNIAKSNDGIADSNRNITIPVSEWNDIQEKIKHQDEIIDFIRRAMPVIIYNYGVFKGRDSNLFLDQRESFIAEILDQNSYRYMFLCKFLMFQKGLRDRDQLKELTADDIDTCNEIYRKHFEGFPPYEPFDMQKLIGIKYDDWNIK